MSSHRTRLKPRPSGPAPADTWPEPATATRCDTNALFQMKNLTDAAVTMEVGFPFAYPDDLRDFKVKVDGKTVENLADKSVGKRQKWKVWTMTFPAGKVTAVEVDY